MIEIRNLRRFIDSVQARKARMEVGITKAYQAHVRMVFEDLVRHSPQYSGSFAANWEIALTNSPGEYTQWYKKGFTGGFTKWVYDPVKMGDEEAVSVALRKAEQVIPRIRWNSIVNFVNHDPTADLLEAGEVILRPVNTIPGYTAVTEYIRAKHLNRLRIE